MFEKKHKINCNVSSCRYNTDAKECELDGISVCVCKDCQGHETACGSYSRR